jgi:hypothetical protein
MTFDRTFRITLLIGIVAATLDSTWANAQVDGGQPGPPPRQDNRVGGEGGVVPALPPDPQSLLEKAISRLESCESISAKTGLSVDLFGKHLTGSGNYLELHTAQSLMFRFELRFKWAEKLVEKGATLLQVCDGPHLWVYQDFRDIKTVAEIDVNRVAKELDEQGRLPQLGIVGQWQGLGGLPKLLRGLYLNFDFTTAEEIRAEDRLPMIRLQGQWKPARLAQMLPDRAEEIKAGRPVGLEKLAPHVPHYAVVYLEQAGLFPRRIEYWRRVPTSPRSQEPPENQLLTAMDLLEPQINVPISRVRFQFDPGKLNVTHQTDRYLEELGLKKRDGG